MVKRRGKFNLNLRKSGFYEIRGLCLVLRNELGIFVSKDDEMIGIVNFNFIIKDIVVYGI